MPSNMHYNMHSSHPANTDCPPFVHSAARCLNFSSHTVDLKEWGRTSCSGVLSELATAHNKSQFHLRLVLLCPLQPSLFDGLFGKQLFQLKVTGLDCGSEQSYSWPLTQAFIWVHSPNLGVRIVLIWDEYVCTVISLLGSDPLRNDNPDNDDRFSHISTEDPSYCKCIRVCCVSFRLTNHTFWMSQLCNSANKTGKTPKSNQVSLLKGYSGVNLIHGLTHCPRLCAETLFVSVAEVWCCSEHYLRLFGGDLYLGPVTAVYCCRAVVSDSVN